MFLLSLISNCPFACCACTEAPSRKEINGNKKMDFIDTTQSILKPAVNIKIQKKGKIGG
jgi:hypothetical protein